VSLGRILLVAERPLMHLLRAFNVIERVRATLKATFGEAGYSRTTSGMFSHSQICIC
jgi:hypothetical protein